MSCNGCRVLRKGCSDTCVLRHCLKCIDCPESQAHATLFLTKFFGRAGLTGFINGVAENQRPALFQSLLYEACGRTVNPVHGAVGLLFSGNWNLCQAAVETVLKGGSPKPAIIDTKLTVNSSLNPSSFHRDLAMAQPLPESSFTSACSFKAPQPNQLLVDYSNYSGSSIEEMIRPQIKRFRDPKQEITMEEEAMVKKPRLSYAAEVHAKKPLSSNLAGYNANYNPSASRVDLPHELLQAPKVDLSNGVMQGQLVVAPVARRVWPSQLVQKTDEIIIKGCGCSQETAKNQLDCNREENPSILSSDYNIGNDHGNRIIKLGLTLNSHPSVCNSSEERLKQEPRLLRVSSPSVNSEGSVTGLDRTTPESPKQELKLLHLLL